MKVKKLLCVSLFSVLALGILTFAILFFVSHWNTKKINKVTELKTTPNASINVNSYSASSFTASSLSSTSPISPSLSLSNLYYFSSLSSHTSPSPSSSISSTSNSSWLKEEMNAIESQASNLNQDVLKLSLTAYQNAQKKGITKNPKLTIVDYSKPSSERRLWVIDVMTKKVLFNTWVAHGKNSGNAISSSFSNQPKSLKSSIGVFVTTETYSGKHGNSLRVQGLESGFNDNAYNRSIVFHAANYVSASIAKAGRLGRSWGCWAVSQEIIGSLVNTIKNNSIVVAYYPDKTWLRKSTFLNYSL
jgi:hypothetical protein